jgi:hypothetical protein
MFRDCRRRAALAGRSEVATSDQGGLFAGSDFMNVTVAWLEIEEDVP